MPLKPFLTALILGPFLMLPPLTLWGQNPEATPSPTEILYAEAINLMNQADLDGALQKINELLAKDPDNAPALNIQGAVNVRKKNFDGAEASFARILQKDPSNAIATFNSAEVSFLRKDYGKSRDTFRKFLQLPGNENNALGRYKVFLCELLGADPGSARKTVENLQPTISNPFYYFAQAAVEFKEGRESKGRELIQSAFSIYPGGMNAAFADSMVELGWVKKEEIASIGAIDASALNSMSQEFQPEKAAPAPDPLSLESLLPNLTPGKKKEDSKTGTQPAQP
ncbi:MAG: tetratricopeptide repeat protein [Candidatus Methylacidiphilales bacterium]|nr:tetratricopeptide repeat protein [Candidatus Methylacidiphilales bacterium]